MKPLRLINMTLKLSGVLGLGQTANAEDTNDAFDMLNMMLSTWNRKRWLVYRLVDIACVADGSQFYTVGPTGDFDVARPDRIESAYVRMLNQSQIMGQMSSTVDYPLDILEAHEDYGALTLKNLVAFPAAVFYDSNVPFGNLYVYPIPTSKYEIHIIVKETLKQFSNLTDDITLPPEYLDAIMWNLAARLRPMYGQQPDPTIIAVAKSSLNVIRGANTQIPDLQMPSGLTRNGGSWDSHGIGGRIEGTFNFDEDGMT